MSIQPSTRTEVLRTERMPRWYTGRSELIVAAGVLLLAGVLAYGTATMEIPGENEWPGPQFFPTIVTGFLAVVGIALAIDVLRPARRARVADDPTEIDDEMLQNLGGIDSTSELRVVSPEEIAAALGEHDGKSVADPPPSNDPSDTAHTDGAPSPAAGGAAAGSGAAQTLDWRTIGAVVGSLVLFILLMPLLGWLLSSAALFWAISWAFGSKRPLFDIGLAALIAGIVQLTFSAGLGLSLPSGILEGVFPWIS